MSKRNQKLWGRIIVKDKIGNCKLWYEFDGENEIYHDCSLDGQVKNAVSEKLAAAATDILLNNDKCGLSEI